MKMFENAFQKTIGLEGGYVNNPLDRGGETKYGISKRAHPDLDIKNLTIDQARLFYRSRYWDPLRLDELESDLIMDEIFDTAVNCGKRGAALIAQKALNFLGENVAVDGWFGQETIGRLNFWLGKDVQALFKTLNGFQFILYVDIVTKDPYQRIFSRGWMKRIQQYSAEGRG